MQQDKPTLTVGELAPDFVLPDYQGQEYQLSAMRGHRTLLFFFRGTFCPDCRRQVGILRQHVARLDEQDVRMLAVARQHPATARGYFRLEPPPIPFLLDMDFSVSTRYGMVYDNDWQQEEYGPQLILPGLYALDAQGIIRYHAFDRPWDSDGSFEQALSALGVTNTNGAS